MKQRCVQAVSQAIGRPITVSESRNIETRIRDNMKREAMRNPEEWAGLSIGDRMRRGAEAAAQELVAEANLKKHRLTKQIEAWDRVSGYVSDQVAKGVDDNKLDAIERLLAPKNDGKNNITSIESSANGIEAASMGKLVDTWEAVSPEFLGLMSRRDMEDAFVREVHGTKSGNAEIAKAVKAWTETTETLRKRYNEAGGDVGSLDNWGMPHSWSQDLANRAGKEQWVSDMLPLVDRSRYVKEDGTRFTDAEMVDFLGNAWLSIASNGANKQRAEGFMKGVKANRGSAERQIHFSDGNAALEAFRKYSDRNLFQVLSGHVKRMASDIALIEQLGPNADHAFEALVDGAYREASVGNPELEAKYSGRVEYLANLYNYVAGNNPPAYSRFWAQFMGDIRAVLSAAKLGSSPISAIADNGTLYTTARVNNIPAIKVFLNQVRGFNPLDKTEADLARRAGLMVRSMTDDVNRFSSDVMGPRWSNKLSTFFMRASGQSALDQVQRRAFATSMMDTIGSLTRKFDSLDKIDADDYRFLISKGITPDEWNIWRMAQPESWGHNHTVLTPDSIYRIDGIDPIAKERAATKLLAVTLEEGNIAVIEPGAAERADMASGTRAGTFKGELLRSIFLFKSFPHAMFKRHISRGLQSYDSWIGKAGYLSMLLAMQTIFGAIALEVNDVLSGRDPRNLNPMEDNGTRNLIAAVLKGGAFGIYGDFLFNEAGASGQTPVETLAGPVAGTIAGFAALTQGNMVQFLRGEETHGGAELAKFLRGITPGSNLWYLKAATDHLIFNQMQEYFSPGYLAKAESRARRNAGTTYWWSPRDAMGENVRAPDFENIVGGN